MKNCSSNSNIGDLHMDCLGLDYSFVTFIDSLTDLIVAFEGFAIIAQLIFNLFFEFVVFELIIPLNI